jgi:SSS family solute:Na+ symporter
MAVAAKLMPTYPLQLAGFSFPGYTALYTVILNLGVAVVLTLLVKAMNPRRVAADETAPADYFPS